MKENSQQNIGSAASHPRWRIRLMGLLMLLIACSGMSAADGNAQPPVLLKTAIFVENRAGEMFKDKASTLEDLIGSRVAGLGFTLLSRQDLTDALKKEGGGTALDKALSEQSAAVSLARNLGADFILMASITSYGTDQKTFKDENVETVIIIHTLRVGYRVLEAGAGGSLAGDTFKVTKQTRATANSTTASSEVLNELLDEASQKLAESLPRKRSLLTNIVVPAKQVEVTIACGMQDLAQLPVSVPDIRVLDDGTTLVTTNRLGIQILDATVEVNGAAVGSAPGKFKVPPGINKIRITREGFKDWERTVSFSEGQKLNVALQMSEAGYARWQNNTTFLLGIETGKKLTDATVKAIEGFAQLLRQSGYRVDTKTDVKADIQTKGKSLLDGANIKVF